MFRSLDDIRRNWSEFYNLLSPTAVGTGRLGERLHIKASRLPKFAKRFNDERGADSGKGENDLAKSFNSFFKIIFDSIVDGNDDELLRLCYVSTDGHKSYNKDFASLLARPSHDFLPADTRPVLTNGKPAPELVGSVSGESSSAVIVLVGSIGSGKTTFIHHFLRVNLASSSGDKRFWFIKDLKSEPEVAAKNPSSESVESRIFQSLLSDVENRFPEIDPFDHDVLRRIFVRDLQRLGKGPRKREFEGSREALLKAEVELLEERAKNQRDLSAGLLRYVREKCGQPLCIALDNVDRASEGYQELIYNLAHRLAAEANAVVVVTMRESVFESAKASGFLDVRNDIVFRVEPPSLQQIFSKRIKYARELLSGKRLPAASGAGAAALLAGYLEVLNELLLGDNDHSRRCLEAISAGNIRHAFDLLKRVSTSAHTDIDWMIREYNEADRKRRRPFYPFRLFLRPLVMGNFYRYHSSRSPIVNLFEVSQTQVESHFLRPRLLAVLWDAYRTSPEGGSRGEMTIAQLHSALSVLGHSEQDIVRVCVDLIRHHLVERISSERNTLSRDDVVRVSAGGSYYLTDLLGSSEYLFFTSQDTVVYESNAYRELERAHRNIEAGKGDRQAPSLIFARYLRQQEAAERGRSPQTRMDWDRNFAAEICDRLDLEGGRGPRP